MFENYRFICDEAKRKEMYFQCMSELYDLCLESQKESRLEIILTFLIAFKEYKELKKLIDLKKISRAVA